MKIFAFEQEVSLPGRQDEVFGFFADARNLQTITPPWLNFEIITPGPVEMRVGVRIDYRLRIHGLPVRWQSEITTWDPPECFVDEQRRGPYRLWIHEHRFEPVNDGTRCVDRVRYGVLGGEWVNRLFVRGDLERIFAYRRKKLVERFTTGNSPSGC